VAAHRRGLRVAGASVLVSRTGYVMLPPIRM
jgi:hypothetical protein